MTRRFALILCDLATRALPSVRKSWGDAMVAELVHTGDDRAAFAFASGCLLAALRERVRDFDSRFAAGLWSIALVTMLLAAARIACAMRGIGVLLLGRHDRMLDLLLRAGASPVLIARYEHARPIVIAGFFALGLAQFATAWLLARSELRRFWVAWSFALAIAIAVVAFEISIVWMPAGLPDEFHPFLLQALALPALLLWSQGRHRRESGP